jgi:tetratricopeptide (TPR) repeat protein
MTRFDEAEAHLGQALFLEPEMEAPRFELIELYRLVSQADAQDRSEQIRRLYKEILALDPTNAKAIFELSLLNDTLARTEEVTQLLGPLAVRSRTDPGPIQVFIELYLETRNYPAAAILLNTMLSADPGNDTLHYFYGVVLNELGRGQEALASFEGVGPDSHYFHNAAAQMAFIYQQQGRIPEAI